MLPLKKVVHPLRLESNTSAFRTWHYCIVTPHIAWSSLEARRRLMGVTVENIRAFLKGSPINRVN
jgi:phosphoglycerate dehydrogenase-like enzyme